MPRNSPSKAISRKKCRSRLVADTGEQGQATPFGRPMSRRQFAYQHAAVLNAEVLREHATAGEW